MTTENKTVSTFGGRFDKIRFRVSTSLLEKYESWISLNSFVPFIKSLFGERK